MELAAACAASVGVEGLALRAGGASGSCVHSFTQLSSTAHSARQCRINFRPSFSTPVLEFSCRHHRTAGGAVSSANWVAGEEVRLMGRDIGGLQPVASFSCGGGRGENDLPHNSCVDQIRDHSLRSPSRLDSRMGGEHHPSRNVDRQSASAASLSSAFTLVEQDRRTSMPLILAGDSHRGTTNRYEVTEADPARQKSLVSPGSVNDPMKQLCVAVDVDEVLGSFLATLNKFIAEEYMLHHDVSEYYIYDFMKIWKCSQAEANNRVHAFFESEHFKNGIRPVPGAHQALLQLAAYCNLVVVTSRQHVIRDHTLDWIERYYSGIFNEVHFGNHFALEGKAKPKSEICRSLGAHILIDDNPRYAIECAECGIEVLLFDLHGSYPWSKTPCGPQHPLITRVMDWKEVERALLARSCVEL